MVKGEEHQHGTYDVVPYSVDLAYAMMARARVTRKVSLPALASR